MTPAPMRWRSPRHNPSGVPEIPLKGDFDATLPRVILDYKWNEDTTLFLSYAEGNNPGGFNVEPLGMDPSAYAAFAAETGVPLFVEQGDLKSYELGIKHSFADGRGFVNATLYTMEWNNQAFGGFWPIAVDSNGDGRFVQGSDRLGEQIEFTANGASDINGFEAAATYVLNDNWRVSASYNYNKSDIKEYADGQHLRVWGTRDASDKEIARSPNHAATFALDFNMPSNQWGGGEWFARWDGWYQSETYVWVINLAETEAALLHNLRGGWQNDRFTIAAWVENATDDDSVLSAVRFTGSFITRQLGFKLSLPEPRTYGLTFTARFGGE